MLSERGSNNRQPGTWYFVILADYGFPLRTERCNFDSEQFTVVRVFVPDSAPRRRVTVSQYTLTASITYPNGSVERRQVRVNRPFWFYPDRASAQRFDAVEWIEPSASIENQIAIVKDVVPPRMKPDFMKEQTGMIGKVPDPRHVPLSTMRNPVRPAVFHELPGTLPREVFRDADGPTHTVYPEVPIPQYKTRVPGSYATIDDKLVSWQEQSGLVVHEPERIDVEYTDMYTPVEFETTKQATVWLRADDGTEFSIPLSEPPRRYRFWPSLIVGQIVPVHFKVKAGVRNRERVEPISVPLPTPSNGNVRGNYPYPSYRNGKDGHKYLIQFPPYRVHLPGGFIDHQGQARRHQPQEVFLRLEPINMWLEDSSDYRTLILTNDMLPTHCKAVVTFDIMPNQPRTATLEWPTPPMAGRWYPEFIWLNEESAREQGEQIYLRAKPSNDVRVKWLHRDGTERGAELPHMTEEMTTPDHALKTKHDRFKHQPAYRVTHEKIHKYAVMRNMKENTSQEYDSTYQAYVEAKDRKSQPPSRAVVEGAPGASGARPKNPVRVAPPVPTIRVTTPARQVTPARGAPPPPTPPLVRKVTANEFFDSSSSSSSDDESESEAGAAGGASRSRKDPKQQPKRRPPSPETRPPENASDNDDDVEEAEEVFEH